MPIELFGRVYGTVVEQLKTWAREKAKMHGSGRGEGALANRILQGWRRHLALALMKARVEFYSLALQRCVEPTAEQRRKTFGRSMMGRVHKPSASIRWGTG